MLFGGRQASVVTKYFGAALVAAVRQSLSGGAGDDTLYIDNADTFVSGGAGYDAAYITGLLGDPGLSLDLGAAGFEFVADFAGNTDVRQQRRTAHRRGLPVRVTGERITARALEKGSNQTD
jgi:hypothetical protein